METSLGIQDMTEAIKLACCLAHLARDCCKVIKNGIKYFKNDDEPRD